MPSLSFISSLDMHSASELVMSLGALMDMMVGIMIDLMGFIEGLV